MDPRLSALPHSAQAAVRDAAKTLETAQRDLVRRRNVLYRAVRHGEAAALRAMQLRRVRSPVLTPAA
jgi:hypothetical protein